MTGSAVNSTPAASASNPALADHLLTLATGLDLTPLELPDQEPMRRAYLQPPTSLPVTPRIAAAVLTAKQATAAAWR